VKDRRRPPVAQAFRPAHGRRAALKGCATSFAFFAAFALSAFSTSDCGKKGPPLPPLVKLPVAPADLAAERRGDVVEIRFTVPATNTDNTRPANIERAEVYAITAPVLPPPLTLTDDQIVRYGTKVAEIAVKAPRNPNLTADADDPGDEVEAPEGSGLDQGAPVRAEEDLDLDVLRPVDLPASAAASKDGHQPEGPLLGPFGDPPMRTYAAVGISKRGKRGPMSKRIAVPLAPPPPAPGAPSISYDERAISVSWKEVSAPTADAGGKDVLPARVLGPPRPEIAYNVYDETHPEAPLKLTAEPTSDAKYSDTRITWGEKRCYSIRATEKIGGGTVESDPGPAACKTLVDTFPPAAPKGLAAIASEGAIGLIWDANTEKDVAGYVVLRGAASDGTLQPVTPAPIQETVYRDPVASGVMYTYAVVAVDKAGNTSQPSARATETAR